MGVIPPVVQAGDGPAKYRVTPQKKSLDGQTGTFPRRNIAGCRDDAGKGLFTCDSALSVYVKESVYPGGADEEITNKWVYLLLNGKLVAEAEARSAQEWYVGYKPNAKAQPADRPLKTFTKGFIRLDGGPADHPNKYGFFLSPIRLTPKALDYLAAHAQGSDSAVVTRAFKGAVASIAIPDPFRWACEAHLLWYQPLLDEYKGYVENPDRSAKLMIASVLKGWMEKGDPAKIKGTLQSGQPQAFLDEYKNEEKKKRTRAERAMAYVAHCVQSPEHRVVELAADEAGGAALANLCCQFAAVTCRADETQPGKELLAAIMADNDRLPRKYFFTDQHRPKGFEFAEWRFAWLAALATFEQLVPAWIKSAKFDAVSDVNLLKKHLEKIDVKTLKGRRITIHRNILQGKDPRTGFGTSATAQRKFQKEMDGLLSEAERFRAELAEAQQLRGPNAKLEKMHTVYKPWLEKIKLSAGTIVEMVNFVLAFDALRKAKRDKGDKIISLIGASADLSAQVLAITEAIMIKRAGGELSQDAAKRLMRLGGALGAVSGACDMREFAGKSGESVGKNDYGQAVGHGIAAAGAAAVSVGGCMALAFSLSQGAMFAGAAGGPLGLVVAAIGSIIIIGGCLIASWLSDNNFQSYAKLCCFGKDAGSGKTVYFKWSSGGLGGGSPVGEARILIDLLSHFQISRGERIQDDLVTLRVLPGCLTAASSFEVWFDRRAYKGRTAPQGNEVLSITLSDKDEVLATEGTRYSLSVTRDSKDPLIIKSFVLQLPAREQSDGSTSFPVKDVWVRLNITGDGKQSAPPIDRLVKMPFKAGTWSVQQYSSLDTDHWINSDGRAYEG